jgi:hypothetical protein
MRKIRGMTAGEASTALAPQKLAHAQPPHVSGLTLWLIKFPRPLYRTIQQSIPYHGKLSCCQLQGCYNGVCIKYILLIEFTKPCKNCYERCAYLQDIAFACYALTTSIARFRKQKSLTSTIAFIS